MRVASKRFGKRRAHRPGLSLVVVVSLVALLTLLAVSLLSLVTISRQSNQLEAESRKSELLAEAAFHSVLADLADEMEKGSTETVVHKLPDGTTYRQYDLTTRRGGMRVTPALQASAPGAGVLVKQSQPGKPFHTWSGAPKPRASAVATGPDPLPAALWNLPQFLAPDETFTDASAPTWTYVARDGSNPLDFSAQVGQTESAGEANPKFVIGRYAYNLYDVSGLLDINAAGHPADQPGDERVGSKGSLVMADLAVLPGMSATAVAKIAAWKHDWSAGTAESTERYLRLSEGTGWRRMVDNDNVFLSRQDLLDFAKLQPAALSREALPFLTHFSRDLNAPTHRPDPARRKIARNAASGGNDAYGADKVVNPDLTAFDEKRQRQLLPRRFPLERLKWVATPTEKNAIDPEKAKRYFGLTWQGTHWKYVNGRANGDLHTLQDVPTDREADFFEILRATVLAEVSVANSPPKVMTTWISGFPCISSAGWTPRSTSTSWNSGPASSTSTTRTATRPASCCPARCGPTTPSARRTCLTCAAHPQSPSAAECCPTSGFSTLTARLPPAKPTKRRWSCSRCCGDCIRR